MDRPFYSTQTTSVLIRLTTHLSERLVGELDVAIGYQRMSGNWLSRSDAINRALSAFFTEQSLSAVDSGLVASAVSGRRRSISMHRTRSEALSLRPHHIDVDTGVIQVLHGKGDRRRTVGIDAGACAVVAEWLEVRTDLAIPPGAPSFPSGRGRELSLSYLRALLPRLAAKAGVDKRGHPHGLRHTHAYELMLEGVEMPIIQRQLGHTSLATTDRCLNHIAPRQVIEAIGKRERSP
jgi:integrase